MEESDKDIPVFDFEEDFDENDHCIPESSVDIVVPAKSLCRFRTVSKQCDQWIFTPTPALKNINHFKDITCLLCELPGGDPSLISPNPDAYAFPCPFLNFLPQTVNIKTTCNGLLCCQDCIGDSVYYICQPVTKEFQELPKSILNHGPEVAVALAAESATIYELICVVTSPDVFLEIYSSRTESWRVFKSSELDGLYGFKLSGDGFYRRGNFYWNVLPGSVLELELKSGKYQILPLPLSIGTPGVGVLTEMHGELCYILPGVQYDVCTLQVYGITDTNLKLVIALHPEAVGQVCCRCDDALIIIIRSRVFAYRVKAQEMEMLGSTWADGYARIMVNVGGFAVDEVDIDYCPRSLIDNPWLLLANGNYPLSFWMRSQSGALIEKRVLKPSDSVISVIGCLDNWICLYSMERFFFYNTFDRESLVIPAPIPIHEGMQISCGFGFCEKNGDYNLVAVFFTEPVPCQFLFSLLERSCIPIPGSDWVNEIPGEPAVYWENSVYWYNWRRSPNTLVGYSFSENEFFTLNRNMSMKTEASGVGVIGVQLVIADAAGSDIRLYGYQRQSNMFEVLHSFQIRCLGRIESIKPVLMVKDKVIYFIINSKIFSYNVGGVVESQGVLYPALILNAFAFEGMF